MRIESEKDRLIITLPQTCTIAETEADADKLRAFPERMKKIEVYAQDTDEMDTAYFQLLLSLKAAAFHREISCSVAGISQAVREIVGLYGAELT